MYSSVLDFVGFPVLSVVLAICSILELETAISTVFAFRVRTSRVGLKPGLVEIYLGSVSDPDQIWAGSGSI